MTIRQHEEVSGTPLHGHIIINDPVVSILLSDAVPKSHPHPIPDENLPRGFIDTYEDADEPALTHWRQTIGTNLVHEMGLKQGVKQFLITGRALSLACTQRKQERSSY